MSKVKRPSISDQKKIDEVMKLMDKYNIKIIKALNSDVTDLVLNIRDKYYAIIDTDYFPPIYDNTEFIKSNPFGQID
jgi:hypothetical protein